MTTRATATAAAGMTKVRAMVAGTNGARSMEVVAANEARVMDVVAEMTVERDMVVGAETTGTAE
jgi:hypothetical protein